MKDETLRTQVVVNVGFTVIKGVSLILSIWVADLYLTASTMGLLLLFRRQGALWGNLLQLGFSQSLQKFYTASADSGKRQILWGTRNHWVLCASAAPLLFTLIFPGQLNNFLFGSIDVFPAWAFGLYVGGVSLGFMACSSWMAEFRFGYANVVDWLNSSLIFILSILLLGKFSSEYIPVFLASATLFASCVSLLIFKWRYIPDVSLFKNSCRLEKTVVGFGITRSFSSFLDMGLLVVGPWMLKDLPQQAGYLLITYNVLRLAQTMIMPVAQVLALRSNSCCHNHKEEAQGVLKLAGVSVVSAGFVVGAYYLFGKATLAIWLPNSASDVALILDRLIPFVPAFCLFYSLRNYIDLKYLFPWNLLILAVAILGLVVTVYIFPAQDISAIIIGSQVMLSVLLLSSISFLCAIAYRLKFEK